MIGTRVEPSRVVNMESITKAVKDLHTAGQLITWSYFNPTHKTNKIMIYVIYYYSLPMQLTQVYINLYSSLLNCISLNGTYFKTMRVSDYDDTVFYFSFLFLKL